MNGHLFNFPSHWTRIILTLCLNFTAEVVQLFKSWNVISSTKGHNDVVSWQDSLYLKSYQSQWNYQLNWLDNLSYSILGYITDCSILTCKRAKDLDKYLFLRYSNHLLLLLYDYAALDILHLESSIYFSFSIFSSELSILK